MSEWKMKEWMRIILNIYFMPTTVTKIQNTPDATLQYQSLTAFLEELYVRRLLLTPAERDAQEKRVRELEELLREIFEAVSDTTTHDVPILFNVIIADDQLYAWHAKAEKALNAGGENEENCTTGGS